jgi:hypothetical protein
MWLTKAHKGVERARDRIGSHLRKVAEADEIQRHAAIPGLELAHFCRHDGPPGESRPCDMQAFAAIQRACRAWEADPERLRSVCGEVFEVADRSTWDKALAARSNSSPKWTPEVASEFPPDLTSSEEDLDSSTTDTEDSDSSSTDTEKATLPSAQPMEEDDAELEEMIAGLQGRAQVRRYVAVLARMRKDLTPCARIHIIKELGWHLGPARETGGCRPR